MAFFYAVKPGFFQKTLDSTHIPLYVGSDDQTDRITEQLENCRLEALLPILSGCYTYCIFLVWSYA